MNLSSNVPSSNYKLTVINAITSFTKKHWTQIKQMRKNEKNLLRIISLLRPVMEQDYRNLVLKQVQKYFCVIVLLWGTDKHFKNTNSQGTSFDCCYHLINMLRLSTNNKCSKLIFFFYRLHRYFVKLCYRCLSFYICAQFAGNMKIYDFF